MRKVFLLFASLVLAMPFAYGDDAADTARAAARNIQSVRQQSQASERGKAETRVQATTRDRAAQLQPAREAATRKQVVSRTAVANKIIQPRADIAVTGIAQPVQRDRPSNIASRAAARPVVSSDAARISSAAARSARTPSRSRAAATTKVIGSGISENYTKCRTTYFSCMDEFCANKDASLRRCACSSRMHDFDDDKKALEAAQTKLTNFQERLLAVNMDKEDAESMVKSSEGEDAFNTKDSSSSKKALDDILKKINSTTSETQQTQSLAAIDLAGASTTADAFDSVDSMLGATTTSKEGDALYRAALPTCVDMAKEVCDTEDIKIVQSAYQMSIEQDCNTIEKNYTLMKSTALGKAKEGSALLDMSRLTNYQDRNSADLLTCTKGMMDALVTDSVCGTNLGKCLDWSGKYIDASTGAAILSSSLANLGDMLVRPSSGGKWAAVPGNINMVKFLETKKSYVEPAMKSCESISQAVWDNFIEDALAQIKLEQENRLEQMRQTCTSVVGQCKSEAEQTIEDFDSRALSIFGVAADTTMNKMCADIQESCDALMKRYLAKGETPNENGESNVGEDWSEGMDKIQLQKTYATILQNCKLIGQECVKLQCQTNDNQFGLCIEQTAAQRRVILNIDLKNNYCYNEVRLCVGNTPIEDLDKIMVENPNDFSTNTYKIDDNTLPGPDVVIPANAKITQNIWGRCFEDTMASKTNYIVAGDTVLSWFGDNTFNGEGSCYTGYCLPDFYYIFGEWAAGRWPTYCSSYGTSAYEACSEFVTDLVQGGMIDGIPDSVVGVYQLSNDNSEGLPTELIYSVAEEENYFTNCCYSEIKDDYGNCCETSDGNYMPGTINSWIKANRPASDLKVCDPTRQCCYETSKSKHTNVKQETTPNYTAPPYKYCKPNNLSWSYVATSGNVHMFCLGTPFNDTHFGVDDVETGDKTCNGTFVTVDTRGIYRSRLIHGAGGIGREKYINFIYDNFSHESERSDLHHKLYVYLPAGGNYITSAGAMNSVSAAGYYNISSNTPEISDVNNKIGAHRVGYCENGFKISIENQQYACCTPEENCKVYKISY